MSENSEEGLGDNAGADRKRAYRASIDRALHSPLQSDEAMRANAREGTDTAINIILTD